MTRFGKLDPRALRARVVPYGIAIATAILIGIAIATIIGLLLKPDDVLVIQVVPVAEKEEVQVQLAGAVARPGVYSLPVGSSVSDALEMAGGIESGGIPDGVDLASNLEDGQFILVPSTNSARDLSTTSIDINSATASELETLPGIGPVISARIVEYRDSIGGFTSVEQLVEVSGISERMVEDLRSLVIIESP